MSQPQTGTGLVGILAAAFLLVVAIGLGMQTPATTAVIWSAGPPLIGTLLGLALALRGANARTRRVVLRSSAVVAFCAGVLTIWGFGLLLITAGALQLWAADQRLDVVPLTCEGDVSRF